MKLISIIMPVYNGASYIREAISSVLGQTYNCWELLVINDGSSDSSSNIVRSFHDPRIKYFCQTNQGVSSARNLGLRKCKGEFICFLDSDDVLPINSLESRLRLFSENVNFVDGKVEYVDSQNNKVLSLYQPLLNCVNPRSSLLKIDGACFMGISWMIRSSVVTHFFKEGLTHGEDLLFLILNSEQGIYMSADSVVLRYRQQGSSAMTNLKGLEKGYLSCLKTIRNNEGITTEFSDIFKSKSRSIMFKSYLKKGLFISALKTLSRFK